MIPFIKADACGNDFLIVDARSIAESTEREIAVRLCSRTTGIGADGVEYLEWIDDRSGRIRLFNADGSVAEISGNGTRCVAAYMAWKKQASAGETVLISTDAGQRNCRIVKAERHRFEIETEMGIPQVKAGKVKLASSATVEGIVVSVGNPHFVIFTDHELFEIDGVPWEKVGREICFHPDFPQQTNVEFVRVLGRDKIAFRIFERGVGPTNSSGTGSCASAAAAIASRGLESRLQVIAPGGGQEVEWARGSAAMRLTGPAELIASGEAF